jgi:hypothetical protein
VLPGKIGEFVGADRLRVGDAAGPSTSAQ